MNACHFNARITNFIFGKSLGVHQKNIKDDDERKSQMGKDSKSDFSTKTKSIVSKSKGERYSQPEVKNYSLQESNQSKVESDRKNFSNFKQKASKIKKSSND